jgi:hypothetical protein
MLSLERALVINTLVPSDIARQLDFTSLRLVSKLPSFRQTVAITLVY